MKLNELKWLAADCEPDPVELRKSIAQYAHFFLGNLRHHQAQRRGPMEHLSHKDTILEIHAALAAATQSGQPYQTPHPAPG